MMHKKVDFILHTTYYFKKNFNIYINIFYVTHYVIFRKKR